MLFWKRRKGNGNGTAYMRSACAMAAGRKVQSAEWWMLAAWAFFDRPQMPDRLVLWDGGDGSMPWERSAELRV